MFINGIGVESRGTTKHHEPENKYIVIHNHCCSKNIIVIDWNLDVTRSAHVNKYLLSIFNGTGLPLSEGSHILVNDSSTFSSFSTTTVKFVPSILQSNQFTDCVPTSVLDCKSLYTTFFFF